MKLRCVDNKEHHVLILPQQEIDTKVNSGELYVDELGYFTYNSLELNRIYCGTYADGQFLIWNPGTELWEKHNINRFVPEEL